MIDTRLVILLVILSVTSISMVSADVPTVTDLEITANTEGDLLTVTIRHGGPTSSHYVTEIEIKMGEEVEVYELEPQETVTFTETYEIPEDEGVEVRAFCNLHGWSPWVSSQVEAEEPTVEDTTSGGIPGFPLLAVGLGLALVLRRDW